MHPLESSPSLYLSSPNSGQELRLALLAPSIPATPLGTKTLPWHRAWKSRWVPTASSHIHTLCSPLALRTSILQICRSAMNELIPSSINLPLTASLLILLCIVTALCKTMASGFHILHPGQPLAQARVPQKPSYWAEQLQIPWFYHKRHSLGRPPPSCLTRWPELPARQGSQLRTPSSVY